MIPPYVDAHVHFWDPAQLRYLWLKDAPAIAQAHTPVELATETETLPLGEIVFVQADCHPDDAGAEVQWVDSLLSGPGIDGIIVAWAPMDRGSFTTQTLADLAAIPTVRGVRQLLQSESRLDSARIRELLPGLLQLPHYGFSFDLCCFASQLPAVIDLVTACPDTRFILDHGGKPAIVRAEFDPWASNIAKLASLPNVSCKLSGLVTEANLTSWSLNDLRPYVDHLLATFGPQRLLFGSDWPVVKLASTYKRWFETAKRLVADLGKDDVDAIFRRNARRYYRFPA